MATGDMHATGDDSGAHAFALAHLALSRLLAVCPHLARHRSELLSDALLGVTKARNRYQPQQGTWPAYALLRARGEMLDGIRTRAPRTDLSPFDGELVTRIPAPRASVEYDRVEDRDQLLRLLSVLPARLAFIVYQVDLLDRSEVDVGLTLGVSGARICQLRSRALRLMRQHALAA